jgi:hypothetical protein
MGREGLQRVLGALERLATRTKTYHSLAALVLGCFVTTFSLALSSPVMAHLVKRFVGLNDSQVFTLFLVGFATSTTLMFAFLLLAFRTSRQEVQLAPRPKGSYQMRIAVVHAATGKPFDGQSDVEVGFQNQDRRSLKLGKDGELAINYPQNLEGSLVSLVVTADQPFRCVAPLREDTTMVVLLPETPSASEPTVGVLERLAARSTKNERSQAFAELSNLVASLRTGCLALPKRQPGDIDDPILSVLLPAAEGLAALEPDAPCCRRYWDYRQTVVRQCTPTTHSATWDVLLDGLDRHILKGPDAKARHALIEETLLIASKIAEDEYQSVRSRFGGVYARLLESLAKDPQGTTSDVIRSVRHLSAEPSALRLVFRAAVNLTLQVPDQLGEGMLELLHDLRDRVFDLDEDIRRLLTNPAFHGKTQPQYDRLLAGRVFTTNGHAPTNGRVWQRKHIPWRTDVVCHFGNGTKPCLCQLDGGGELSFRGFYAPRCSQPFEAGMRSIALTVQSQHGNRPALQLNEMVGHVVPTHPQETNRTGRGIRIDALPGSCRERLYEYLEQIPSN